MSLAPVVQDWLETLHSLAQDRQQILENQEYMTSSSIEADLLARKSRGIPEREELIVEERRLRYELADAFDKKAKLRGPSIALLPLLQQAHLFDLSPDIQIACGKRSVSMVGVPDLAALPFPVCWFNIRSWNTEITNIEDNRNLNKEKVTVIALVATRSGKLLWVLTSARGAYVHCDDVVTDEGWDAKSLDGIWGAYLMAAVINGQVSQRPSTQSFSVRRELGKLRALGVTTPPPDLYTMTLDRRKAARAVSMAIAAHSGPSYRYEVRKHERMLVHRGHWPLRSPEALLKQGYVIERGDQLDERAHLGLELRSIPTGTRDEWVAWKFVPVREHEAGLKGGELRRALRTTGKA